MKNNGKQNQIFEKRIPSGSCVNSFLFAFNSGPNSIAKCRVLPDSDGRHVVNYTPVEVGYFTIQVKWNGREVPGENRSHHATSL